MKKTFSTMLSLLLAFVSVGLTVSFNAEAADQPFMKDARTDLNKAKASLRKATADKGGHRVKAISLVDEAISEVNAGIAYDRRNSHAFVLRYGAADQPNMQAALDHLRNARENLNKATADKGGHRAKAISLVNQAIDEVQKGIEADRRN